MGKIMLRNGTFSNLKIFPPMLSITCKDENSSFTLEKTGRHYLKQEIKTNSQVIYKSCSHYVPLTGWSKKATTWLQWYFGKNTWSQSDPVKTSQLRSRDYIQNNWPVLWRLCKTKQNTEDLRQTVNRLMRHGN